MRLPLHAHWSHGISAALLGVLILLPATPASAQSRDDFAYWDANGNGDLTCAEADEGLRLPAYQDNRDGTGLIYEWLERSRSSDGNNDGVACENSSNPDGYIPNVTVDPPPQPRPDLVVPGPNVSETSVETGETFWFIATVTNDGDAQSQSAATTVRYLRSTDATITESDTEEGTDEVRALLLNQGYAATIRLTAPSTAGTYYYGACVDAVAGESDTTNNCSASVQVDVSEPQVEPPVVEPPVETLTCSADAETWRGLQVCDERPRDGYDRDAFGTGYSSLEDEIIAALPPTMKANEQVYTPYSCLAFDITAAGTAATDIEHIVALAETHDSGIADDRRRDIASDLDNLTIADPTVNRSQKSDRDAAEWMPARHGAWFAEQVIQVKLEYGLSIDPAERDALEALLAGGGAQLNCVDAIAPTPTMLTLSTTSAPAEGGNPVTVTATLDNPAPANGLTVTLTTSGTATLDTDYTLSSTTITLAEGETAGTVTITVTDDAEDDDGETIVIDAESTSPALTADQLTLTIEDNDGPLPTMLTLSADPAPAEGGEPVTVTATLDNPAPADGTTVTLTTSGTATLDTDYTLSSTTITLAEGETAGTVTITVTDDAEDDDGETIVIDAESTSPALTADQLTLTIEDNDGPLPTMLTLSADPAPAEGGEPVTVTATLDNPAPADGTTVTLTTGGTATLDTDYTLSSTTITLAEGETAGTATITVADDAEDDDGETIVIDAESTNPALTAAQLTLTIEDNDVTPVPALPLLWQLLLGLGLLGSGARQLYRRQHVLPEA